MVKLHWGHLSWGPKPSLAGLACCFGARLGDELPPSHAHAVERPSSRLLAEGFFRSYRDELGVLHPLAWAGRCRQLLDELLHCFGDRLQDRLGCCRCTLLRRRLLLEELGFLGCELSFRQQALVEKRLQIAQTVRTGGGSRHVWVSGGYGMSGSAASLTTFVVAVSRHRERPKVAELTSHHRFAAESANPNSQGLI